MLSFFVMKKKDGIKLLICIMSFLFVFMIFFLILTLIFKKDIFLAFFIIFFTTLYHFLMRVIVGETVTLIYGKKEFNNDSFWFKEHKFEKSIYEKLKVKKWKDKLITAKPEQFDINNDFGMILHNINQAEIVHEISIILSFVPMLFSLFLGYWYVFLIISIFASLIDLIFVIIQRYNRPRIKGILERMERRK